MTDLIPINDHAIGEQRADGLQSLSWRGVITLLSSLSHGAGTSGNISLFNTEKTLSHGRSVRVPFVTGNAMKHRVVRRTGMDFMLRYLGLEGQLSRACLQLLYSGGFLSAKGATVDLGKFLEIAEHIPLLGLLGGSLGNVIQESRIQADCAILICAENDWRLPKDLDRPSLPKMAACRDVVGYTRGDASKQHTKQRMLTDDQRQLTVHAITESKRKRELGEHPGDAERQQSTQMRHEVEVVVAGSEFWWEVQVHDAAPVEVGAFFSALLGFARCPYIGGKSNIGHGKVRLNMDKWSVDPLSKTHANEIAIPGLDAYQAHLDEGREKVSKTLKGIK